MPQSLSRVWLHFVWSTLQRKPFLSDPSVRDEMWRMLATTLKENDCQPAKIGGVDDHVHILCGLSRNHAIKDIVQHVKTETSSWVKKKGPDMRPFHWQAGYGVFSVSESNKDAVVRYIQNQQEHHRRLSFKDEFRQICKRHHVEIDERYVWE